MTDSRVHKVYLPKTTRVRNKSEDETAIVHECNGVNSVHGLTEREQERERCKMCPNTCAVF